MLNMRYVITNRYNKYHRIRENPRTFYCLLSMCREGFLHRDTEAINRPNAHPWCVYVVVVCVCVCVSVWLIGEALY